MFATPASQRRIAHSPRRWIDSVVLAVISSTADLLPGLIANEREENRFRVAERLCSLWLDTHRLPTCPLLHLLYEQLRGREVWRVRVASQAAAASALDAARNTLLAASATHHGASKHTSWDPTVRVQARYSSTAAARYASDAALQAVQHTLAAYTVPDHIADFRNALRDRGFDIHAAEQLAHYLPIEWPFEFTHTDPAANGAIDYSRDDDEEQKNSQ
jgi:hypothetical protein